MTRDEREKMDLEGRSKKVKKDKKERRRVKIEERKTKKD